MPRKRPERLRGVNVTRTFVCSSGVLKDLDRLVVEPIRAASGFKANRSRVIQACLEIVCASAREIEMNAVIDKSTLVRQIRRAIVRSARRATINREK
jgi:hypothetical protein